MRDGSRDLRGWLPLARQELLLRAALLRDHGAVAAWGKWLRDTDFATLDLGSVRLLPLAWANLQRLGVEHFPLPVVAAAADTWLANQRRFQDTAGLVLALRAAGIDTIVLKGVALAVSYYGDPALRPMSDVDLLVPHDRARDAIAVLSRVGWIPVRPRPETYVRYQHAAEWIGPDGGRCDLHWKIFWDTRPDASDADFWSAAIPLEVAGATTLALCPSDQLMHVCVHGTAWNEMPPIRWIADAAMILERSRSDIDWQRIMRLARNRGLVLHLRETFRHLEEFLHPGVPSDVMVALEQTPVPWFARGLFRIRTGSGELLRSLPTCVHLARAWRASPEPFLRRTVELCQYLQSLWGVQRLWHAPAYLVVKVFRRLVLAARRAH